MIHHLILLEDEADVQVQHGKLISCGKKIALDVLGSVQCFSTKARWSQSALEGLASQCPVIFVRWDSRAKKWMTASMVPRCRYVNPSAQVKVCRLGERKATQLASDLLWAKIENQHLMLRVFDPLLGPLPKLKDNSFSRILRLEAKYARFFWARYFRAASTDLFAREKRRAQHPLNAALNYGYGFLYHALEWQCAASGLEPGVGIVHKLRRSRPSLVCDLIEPFRCCVELTVIRNLDEMHDKKMMAGRYAEMMEETWTYRGRRFRLRSIIRLVVESFVQALEGKRAFEPFALQPRDACV
jgi:CRISPR-associated endonuclease Cas1